MAIKGGLSSLVPADMDFKSRLMRVEPYIFYLLCFVLVIPVIRVEVFPTIDGGAHTYNSNLIKYLLSDSRQYLSQYFSLNEEPVPNWLGHFLLMFFNFFLAPEWSEKLLQIIYVLSLPLSFRFLVSSYKVKLNFTFLIFPFVYSFVFVMGFYNFSLALILFFVTLACWNRYRNNLNAIKVFILFLLITLTYFSHLFIYAFLELTLFFCLTMEILYKWKEASLSLGKVIHSHLRKIIVFAVISVPAFVLFCNYMLSRKAGKDLFLGVDELINNIFFLQPVTGYNTAEYPYSRLLFLVLFALLVIGAYRNSVNNRGIPAREKIMRALSEKNIFMLMGLLCLFLYFKMPDANDMGGFISVRILALAALLMVAWINVQQMSMRLSYVLIPFVMYSMFGIMMGRLRFMDEVSRVSSEVLNASEKIESHSTIVPFNFADRFLFCHTSTYLGADKPVVNLQNYEASLGWFPVKWNFKKMPNILVGKLASPHNSQHSWATADTANPVQADYVFIIGKKYRENRDAFTVSLLENLQESYLLIYETESTSLFESRTRTVNSK
jgi:hypothetical protein